MKHISVERSHRKEQFLFPGLVVAGLRGGSGKTIFSIGIIAVLEGLGISVAPFKKGPDYIDAGWLGLAAGRLCHNLDTFLLEPSVVIESYQTHTFDADISLIEGNRGLYDCINTEGETSTAALAVLLGLPVILCVDVAKTTRTMAAVISGILSFDPDVRIGGVILNRVAGVRHQNILTKSIEKYCGIPILGAVPKLRYECFPERHMGLVPTVEHEWANSSIQLVSSVVRKYLDISLIMRIAGYFDLKKQEIRPTDEVLNHGIVVVHPDDKKVIKDDGLRSQPIIGVMLDSAFQFYYPENFQALEEAGAILKFISPLESQSISEVDALYIGGGFPETHAKKLEANLQFRDQVKRLADLGMPIYAECGGLIYLGEGLIVGKTSFEMTGVLPAVFKIWDRPRGHGYSILRVEKENPYYPTGISFLGHEFHYSSVDEWNSGEWELAFSMERGVGFSDKMDGVFYKNTMATYTHIHALGTRSWAPALVRLALAYMGKDKTKKRVCSYRLIQKRAD